MYQYLSTEVHEESKLEDDKAVRADLVRIVGKAQLEHVVSPEGRR